MFSSYKTTTKIKWLTIALMLVVVFVGSFNPVVALADETDVVVSDVVEVEPEVVAVEESAEVEDSLVDTQSAATEVGVELVKDSEIIKDNDPIVTEGEVILDNSVNEGVVVEELPEVATEPVVPDTSVTEEVVASSTPGVTVVDNTPVLSGDAVIESEVTPQDSHTVLEDISTEYGDNTNDSEIPSDIIEAISIEYSVVVNPGSGIGQEEVSLQYSFNTNNNPNPEVDEEISRQYSFITVSDIGHDEEISAQYSFTTEDDGNTDLDEEVSREYSFRTQNGGNPDLDEEISSEYNFTTDNNGGGGCTSNCGGGGGGGGGRNRDRDRDDEVLPTQCLPLILEYIRFGRNNNPIEVLKLQWFLRTFEGFDVPLSGYYDRTTYEAVRIFQTRHADPILTSWGISEPTGFVFISTSLNINYIYCDIQGVQFDLRNFYKNVKPTYISMPKKGDGANYLLLPPPIQNNAGDEYMTLDVDLPKEIAVKNEGFLQVAMIGLLNFFGGIGDYFKNLWTGLTDWFKQIKDGNIVEALSLVRWWVWLLWIGFLMIVIGLVLIWKRLRDLKIENALLEESNQEMIEAEIELDNLEEVVEAETLADLVEEYNEHIAPEELETSHLEHISETLKDKVIELEEEVKNKK